MSSHSIALNSNETSRETENNCESLRPICPTLGDSSKSDIETVLGWDIDTATIFLDILIRRLNSGTRSSN